MSRINTNVSSLFAQKTLARTNDQLNTAMSRLSSGLRINTAADDPAGLIASEVLRAEMTGVSQAITNTDRADQLIQTADSALGQVSNLLNDIRGLVVEAANDGALSAEQIAANQLQVDSSLEAIDRIARTTAFGGKKLLDGSLEMVTSTSSTNIADIDVQQVNLGSSATAGTLFDTMSVAVANITAATQGSLTDDSTARNNDGASYSFKLGTATGNQREFNIVVDTSTAAGQAIDNLEIQITATNNTNADVTLSGNVLTIALDDDDAGGGTADGNDSERIEARINALSAFTGSTVQTGGIDMSGVSDVRDLILDDLAIDASTSKFSGGNTGDTGASAGLNVINKVNAERVVQISGALGSETFTFAKGTSQQQIQAQVNAMSDSTGVSATYDSTLDRVSFVSTEYGSDQFVDVEVISEGTGGVYASNASAIGRSTGTDIQGTINGITASGKGNTLSIYSSVLTADVRMAANSTTDASFDITGGGANFQLGADVISPQQARVGIESVSTGSLGGESGTLYQLRSGQNAALATDSITAGKIVDEAILSVANSRGRLGAFSATTLDSNKTALSDYLVNLTDAESALRDADFAKESAALTRAQVLVQSGTSILAIANQNPQNMLALIR